MGLASSLQKVANKVIGKLGGDVTVRIVTGGSYNTTTGAITESESDSTIKGVLSDVALREVNELVQAGDKILTVPAEEFTSRPNNRDKVLISSVIHQIIEVRVEEMNGIDLLYDFVLRA